MNKNVLCFSFLAVATSGCAIEKVTTEIRVRDPHAVLTRTDASGPRPSSFPSDNTIVLNAPSSTTITPEVLAASTFDLRWSTPLGRDPRGEHRTYDVMPLDAATEGTVGYRLQADWADIRIVEHRRPDHAGAWAIIGLSTVAFGALSAIVFAAPDVKGGPAVRTGLGLGVAGVGAAYDVAMIPTLATSDADIVVHDFGQRIGTKPIVID